MHTFIYARVSTAGQTTENQLLEIERAGYEADAIFADTISGKVPAMERPEFAKLMDTISRTRKPKRLIVSKLDRLGRDAVDILGSVVLGAGRLLGSCPQQRPGPDFVGWQLVLSTLAQSPRWKEICWWSAPRRAWPEPGLKEAPRR